MIVITNDMAFDMLPHAVDLFDKLELIDYYKEFKEKYKGKNMDKIEAGIEFFRYILKNLGKAKQEVYSIVAIMEGKTAEEVLNQPFAKTIMTFKSILADKETMDFFKQAML